MRFAEIREQCLRDMGHANTNPGAEVISTTEGRINAAYLGLAGKANWSWWFTEFTAALPLGATRLSLPRNYTGLSAIRNADGVLVHANHTDDLAKYRTTAKLRCAEGAVSFRDYATLGSVALTLNSDLVTSVTVLPADIVGRTLFFPTLERDFLIVERVDDNTMRINEQYPEASAAALQAVIDPAGSRSLLLDLPSGKAETLTVRYFFRPAPLVDDDDVPHLPEEYHYYLVVKPRDQLLQVQREGQGLVGQAKYASDEILSDMMRANLDMLRNINRRLRARI